jgi:hypothetical protein
MEEYSPKEAAPFSISFRNWHGVKFYSPRNRHLLFFGVRQKTETGLWKQIEEAGRVWLTLKVKKILHEGTSRNLKSLIILNKAKIWA